MTALDHGGDIEAVRQHCETEIQGLLNEGNAEPPRDPAESLTFVSLTYLSRHRRLH